MTAAAPDLQTLYRLLLDHFGSQQWWPAETPFEVVVGAILTQNTAWTNVEKAIVNLKTAGCLTPQQIAATGSAELETLIRPAGFFRQKAARLRYVAIELADKYQASVAQFCAGPLDMARQRLLALPGVGPETADSILLYAAHRPSFVVDAYTRRILTRLGCLDGGERYEAIRARFMTELPNDAAIFNEYHALLVTLAKRLCRKQRPECPACPLRPVCRFALEDANTLT